MSFATEPSRQRSPDFTATIAALARPSDIRALPLTQLHVVVAMRMAALFERSDRDPVGELTQRFRSVTAALAVFRLISEVTRTWPDHFLANRPCCLGMSPDEQTLAALCRAAAAGDRRGFTRAIAGFIRDDRHERLFASTVVAVAALQQRDGCG